MDIIETFIASTVVFTITFVAPAFVIFNLYLGA